MMPTAARSYHVVFLTDDGTSTKGFVVVAGDDEAEPILAISSGSDFGSVAGDPLAALINRHASGMLKQLRKPGPRVRGVDAYAASRRGRQK